MMKLWNLVFSLLIILICNQCKKPVPLDPWDYTGGCTAHLNGKPWEAYSMIKYISFGSVVTDSNKINLTCGHFTVDWIKQYSLFIANIPLHFGEFELLDTSIYSLVPTAYFHTTEADILRDSYVIYKNESSWIKIINIQENEEYLLIESEFQISFLRDTTFLSSGVYPDTMRLTDGKLKAKLAL